MREGRTFKSVFDDLCGALDFAPTDVTGNAALSAKVLGCFQRGYRAAYRKRPWEDVWKDGELTPTGRLITHLQIEDARFYEFWSADPRVSSTSGGAAYPIASTVSQDGLTLAEEVETVFAFFMPKQPRFTLTAYGSGTTYAAGALVLYSDEHVYLSLQGSNTNKLPTTETAWWRQVPVLEVLAEAVVHLAAGRYLIGEGSFEAGNARLGLGKQELEMEAMTEYGRLARQDGWRPGQGLPLWEWCGGV